MADNWQVEALDQRRFCQKQRRSLPGVPQSLDTLPVEWRQLLSRWVQRGGNSKWDTLRKDAGANHVQLADDLLNWLLRHHWANVIEHWEHSAWWPKQVELQHLPQLRSALGLRDKENDLQRWSALHAELAASLDAPLLPALQTLAELPLTRSLSRHDLLNALQRWHTDQKSGTRRDFSLFCRGDTKAVSDAEWNWLESVVDLAEFGIERHTPLLLIAAPLRLRTPRGQLDLNAGADFVALTPATLADIVEASGTVKFWHLIENRTSFERAARQRESDAGVIWLPGFPPGWWRDAVARLLDRAPAMALLSCDPDPSGIAITLKAAELWVARSLAWQPWKMAASDLAAMRSRKPLSDADLQQLAALQRLSLHAQLAELAEWMLEHGEKGEQEGYL